MFDVSRFTDRPPSGYSFGLSKDATCNALVQFLSFGLSKDATCNALVEFLNLIRDNRILLQEAEVGGIAKNTDYLLRKLTIVYAEKWDEDRSEGPIQPPTAELLKTIPTEHLLKEMAERGYESALTLHGADARVPVDRQKVDDGQSGTGRAS